MAHPHKSEGSDAHNAKLQRMTRHYGAASGSANNIKSPTEFLKGSGPEEATGFGADYAAASPRSDKPARRAVSVSPPATMKRGGHIKPVEVASRARGGRMKHGKGATHVNVIVAPHSAPPPGAGMPSPQLAALASGHPPVPPSPPPQPPMAAGPMPAGPMAPPSGGMPPGMMPRKRGGRTVHDDAAEDKQLIKQTLREEGLIRKARGGGIHLSAGADSGIGRLEKMGLSPPKVKKQEV